jgi:MOSC domain-containing protein YiiM
MGRVEGIFTAAGAGQPMTPLAEVLAVAGRGLAGDRYHDRTGYYSERPSPGGGRELTLIEAEVLESLATEHGIELAPSECRRNVLTRGVRLQELIRRRFRIGEVLCEGMRICEPCLYLEQVTGKPVNEPLVHRGGLRANILEGGTIRVGDPIGPLGESGRPADDGARSADAQAREAAR